MLYLNGAEVAPYGYDALYLNGHQVWPYKPKWPQHGLASDYTWAEVKQVAEYIEGLTSAQLATDAAVSLFTSFVGSDWYVGDLDSSSALYSATSVAEDRKVYARLMDVCHDDLASPATGTSGKAAFTFKFKGGLPLAYTMNGSNTNVGGWGSSRLRTQRLASNCEIYNAVPTAVTDNMVLVNKYTNNVGQTSSSSSVTATADGLWIMSIAEFLGSGSVSAFTTDANQYTLPNEGTQYKYYADQGLTWGSAAALAALHLEYTNSGVQIAKNKVGANESGKATHWPASWYFRSPDATVSTMFFRMNSDEAGLLPRNATGPFSIIVCFCV